LDFFQQQENALRSSRWLIVSYVVTLLVIVSLISSLVLSISGGTIFYKPSLLEMVPSNTSLIPIYQRDVWQHVNWPPVLMLAGALVLIMAGVSFYESMTLRRGGGVRIAELLGGRLVTGNEKDPDYQKLYNVVQEMAIASGVAMPNLYILEQEESINAFAAGYSTDDAVIGVTKGASSKLNRDELQ